MRELLLYTTSGCHLCEQAEQELAPVLTFINAAMSEGRGKVESQIRIRLVEIAENPKLMAAYGLRIPVVRLEGCEPELGWPFDQSRAFEFLSNQLS